MCLAISKPKGISISEEHLHNGWLNNNDGAGFVCITDTEEFLIHKSMTYEGFIDVYKEAVEKYGDTSDFLIHFRIASKGNTTLENCHPFIVDADRVIIHNGTLYNIDIDKKDKRSDTKVFAEDWLSQLPENWEDNRVLQLMLEDFIGSGSKICMLHRTKGTYIFNQEKGFWVDEVWYSNKSYEKHTPISVIYPTKEFYSFKFLRMLTLEEVNKMSYREMDEHRSYSTVSRGNNSDIKYAGYAWIPCDICGEYDVDTDMVDMESDHTKQKWCWDCYKSAVACDFCGKNFQEKDVDDYYNNVSMELVTLCDECASTMGNVKLEKVEEIISEEINEVIGG